MNAAAMVILCWWSAVSGPGLPPSCGAPVDQAVVPHGLLRKPAVAALGVDTARMGLVLPSLHFCQMAGSSSGFRVSS